jgi:hypothetical protein
MKSVRREGPETYRIPDNNTYYSLTLDPCVKDHRIIALLTDYTSRSQECPFYSPDDQKRHCNIAPEFTVMWSDCGGRCFVDGLTCPIIAEHFKELEESGRTDKNSVE